MTTIVRPSTEPQAGDAEAVVDRSVQVAWAAMPIRDRLRVLQRARHEIAAAASELVKEISPELARTEADTMVAEVLPLLAACRFLESEGRAILARRRLGSAGRPIWLGGVQSEVHRVPLGTVLIIGPANYPLLLPGVQTLQALLAGNAVIWKPGRGGRAVAVRVAAALRRSGLPGGLLHVTDESVQAAEDAISAGVDKVFFTGSRAAGRVILHRLAETLTPSVMELSGNDAVVFLPGADLDRVVKALTFGMRLNGSATCMAPRRAILLDCDPARRHSFIDQLKQALAEVPAVSLLEPVQQQLIDLVKRAEARGAEVIGDAAASALKPILVLKGNKDMELASADIFAPVLMLLEAERPDLGALLNASPLALTVSIFGPEREAREIAASVTAGAVLINDLIVPTADPRLPFGGRKESGFGVTRGREGLLEMTAAQTVVVRRGRSKKHYEATGDGHAAMFRGFITASHAGTWKARWRGLRETVQAASRLRS